MCPFKKAFPFVLLMHLIFAAGIFAAFGQHGGVAQKIFTLWPAMGVGEELSVGTAASAANEKTLTQAAPQECVSPAPKIMPKPAESQEAARPSLLSEDVQSPISNLKSPAPAAGSIAGSTPSNFARVGGSVDALAVGGRITPPVALHRPKPARPSGALRGEVSVVFTIDERGAVQQVQVERSPSEAMTAAVLAVLPRWRFSPAQESGRPISLRVRQVVEF